MQTSIRPGLKSKTRSLAHGFQQNKQIYLMILPNVIMFALFSIYPIGWVLKFMFYQYDKINAPIFIGLDNFVRIFTRDAYFWKTVGNTFYYVGGKLLITLPVAFVIAVLLNKKFFGSRLMQSIVFMPTIMSASVMALIFYLILNPYSGALNTMLMKLDLINVPINWLNYYNSLDTIIMVGVWGAVGNYMVYFLAGLQSVPQDIYESAELDGITPVRKMFSITIPMMTPVLKTVVMLVLISSFQDIQTIMVLTEGGPNGASDVMFLYVYRMFFPISATVASTSQFGYGAALSVVCASLIGAVTILYLRVTRKVDDIF